MERRRPGGWKLVACLVFCVATLSAAQAQEAFAMRLQMADSLFVKKQYTQSLDLYQQIFDLGSFSPAMLLKMAFIEEGLGHTSRSLYYLTIYYNYTRDEQALLKMEEVAARDNLTGYEIAGNEKFIALLEEYRQPITLLLGSISVFLFALVVVFRKNKQHAFAPFVLMIVFLLSLGTFVNVDLHKRWGIITDQQVYLMSGPSPASKVVAIISDGHRLAINGKQDVWTRVKWGERNVFVKQNQVLEVKL